MITFNQSVVGPWVASHISGMKYIQGSAAAIGRIKDGQIVAGVLYEDYNGVNVVCHIAGVGRWLDRRYLSIIFDYPFHQLNVKRITATVVSTNKASRRLVEHLGFSLEAILQDAHPQGHLCIYKMTVDRCKWLHKLPYSMFESNSGE